MTTSKKRGSCADLQLAHGGLNIKERSSSFRSVTSLRQVLRHRSAHCLEAALAAAAIANIAV
jgi:hypothetical protein